MLLSRFLLATTLALPCSLPAAHWPQFRGPEGRAVAEGSTAAPTEFGQNKNVVWKIPLPSGHSSPILWGDRIFLTAFDQGKLLAVCLDRANGQLIWQKKMPAATIEPYHRIGSPAASTPCTDGERVVFYFGSAGLLCLDFEGKELWRLAMPIPVNDFGTGTSPILVEGKVLLLRDQDMGSFLLALDARTGRQVWKTERPGLFRGHSTPFLWRHDGKQEIIVTGSVWLKSYDLTSGRELWSSTGLSRVANASATAGDGLLFASSWNIGADATGRLELPPFDEFLKANDKNGDGALSEQEFPNGLLRGRYTQLDADKDGRVTRAEWEAQTEIFGKAENALLALRPGGTGELSMAQIAWRKSRGLPYVPSPLYYDGRIFTVKSGGMVSCFEAKTGKELWLEERVGIIGDFYASPVAAAGKVYFAAQKGTVAVLAAGDTFRVLATNDLGEPIFATPAIVEGRIYLRTTGHLYCFGRGKL